MITLTLVQRAALRPRRGGVAMADSHAPDEQVRAEQEIVQPPGATIAPPRSTELREFVLDGGGGGSTLPAGIPGRTRFERVADDRRLHAPVRDRAPLLRAVPLDGLDVAEDAAGDGELQPAPEAPDAACVPGRAHDRSTSRATRRTASGSRSTVTLLNVFLCSLGGYAFARLRVPGPRGALLARAGDADGPRPAAARPDLRQVQRVAPPRPLPRRTSWSSSRRPRSSS